MTSGATRQDVVAVVWDFDKTLIPGYMQSPLFERFGVDEETFWREVQGLPAYYEAHGHPLVSSDTLYLSHILTYVREGKFPDLNNATLAELGGEVELYPGMPDFLALTRKTVEQDERWARHGIALEHYVVSTGLRQMILGNPVADAVDGVWGCEFLETTAPPGFLGDSPDPGPRVIQNVAYAIDSTTKTRAIFEINKGVNRYPQDISVNDSIAPTDRRVPFENMVYVADGPSDIPVFSIVNRYGGETFAVYNPDSGMEFQQVLRLQDQGRVKAIGSADYTEGSHTARYLMARIAGIAERIRMALEGDLRRSVGKSPEHLHERPSDATEAPQDALAERVAAAAPGAGSGRDGRAGQAGI